MYVCTYACYKLFVFHFHFGFCQPTDKIPLDSIPCSSRSIGLLSPSYCIPRNFIDWRRRRRRRRRKRKSLIMNAFGSSCIQSSHVIMMTRTKKRIKYGKRIIHTHTQATWRFELLSWNLSSVVSQERERGHLILTTVLRIPNMIKIG